MALEQAKIRVEDHRIVYWTSTGAKGALEIAHAVPYCNVAFLLLGPGCSISSEAMELLAAANVVIGFTGAACTPLNAGVEPIAFACGQSEYRPTAYMQTWARWWFDDAQRLAKGRELLAWRAQLLDEVWTSSLLRHVLDDCRIPPLDPQGFFQQRAPQPPATGAAQTQAPRAKPTTLLARATASTAPPTAPKPGGAQDYVQERFGGQSTEQLLGQEGDHVKRLYRYLAAHTGTDFNGRDPHRSDGVNALLTMGNYVAYGLAATALHGLGISFSFAILHGKTRRGALVFDIADPVKDALVAPIAFACARAGKDKDTCRRMLKQALEDGRMLARTMDFVKSLAT